MDIRNNKGLFQGLLSFAFVLISYSMLLGSGSPTVTEITDREMTYDLSASCQILEVMKGEVGIEDLVSGPDKYPFRAPREVRLESRSEELGYWIRFSIQNQTDGDLFVLIPFYGTDTIIFYEVRGKEALPAQYSGDKLAFNDHRFKSNSTLFPVSAEKGEVMEGYLYVAGANMPSLPFFITTPNHIIQSSHRNDLFDGIYFGFILIIILYNLVLFIQIRERDHLVYSLWVVLMALQLSIFKGHAESFLWPSTPLLNDYVDSFTSLTGIAHILFTFVILKMRRTMKGWRRAGLLLIVLYSSVVLINIAGLTSKYYSSINPGNVALLEGIWSIIVGVTAYRKGFRPAIYYVIGNVALFTSIFIFFFYAFGYLPHNFLTYNSMLIGSGLEVIFFSLALASKVNILKKQKEESERQTLLIWQENNRLIKEQNIMLEDQVKRRTSELEQEKNKSEELLLNILPEETAVELKKYGKSLARKFDPVTIMFTDFKGFTNIAESMEPEELVNEINECFTEFDRIMEKHGVEKIKTIGDAYMAVSGLPVPDPGHAKKMVRAAMELCRFMEQWQQLKRDQGKPVFEVRIGMHTGPVVAGIVGLKKFAYDIWGDAVNLASRMEAGGEPGKINISQSTYELVKEDFDCTYRGMIDVKGKGRMEMYFVNSTFKAVNLTED